MSMFLPCCDACSNGGLQTKESWRCYLLSPRCLSSIKPCMADYLGQQETKADSTLGRASHPPLRHRHSAVCCDEGWQVLMRTRNIFLLSIFTWFLVFPYSRNEIRFTLTHRGSLNLIHHSIQDTWSIWNIVEISNICTLPNQMPELKRP